MPISGPVGEGAMNNPADVQHVEECLANHQHWLIPMPALVPDGFCAPETVLAIRRFQERACASPHSEFEGYVYPNSFTLWRLETGYLPKPAHKVFTTLKWERPANELTGTHYAAAAKDLGCEVEAIEAVVEVESKIRGPWDKLGRPTILFERHIFAACSDNLYNRTHPDISNTKTSLSDHSYGDYSVQYPKLHRAATLNENAALKAASWGTFQILGKNHTAAGYDSVESFVDAMLENQVKHLDAFVAFIKANPGLQKALKNCSWAVFAKGYNGPSYKDNAYDTKMKAAYDRLKAAAKAKAKAAAKPGAGSPPKK